LTNGSCTEVEFHSEESGAAMLHYAPNYNGVLLAEALNQETIKIARLSLMLEILSLEGNIVSTPEMIKELVHQ